MEASGQLHAPAGERSPATHSTGDLIALESRSGRGGEQRKPPLPGKRMRNVCRKVDCILTEVSLCIERFASSFRTTIL
jgi:hypothetical protein